MRDSSQIKENDPPSASNVEPAPAVIANKIGTEYERGVGKMEDRLLILLDLNKLLSVNEHRNINTIATEAAAAIA